MKKRLVLLLSSSLLLTSIVGCTQDNPPVVENEELKQIKEEIASYIKNFDLSIYRESEKNQIQALFTSLQGLVETSTDVEELKTSLANVKSTIDSLKTDADYKKEEEAEAKEKLRIAKEDKIKSLTIEDGNQYRIEEKTVLDNKIAEMSTEINALTTLEEVNSYSLSPLETLKGTLKTNAQYTTSEMLKYGTDSNWALVNEHRDQMVYDGDHTIKTGEDGYSLDSYDYATNGLSMSFSVNTENYVSIAGALLANKSTVGDGLDGYAIVVNRAADHEWYQVWYLNNCYASYGETICNYIGGWVYSDNYPGESVTNNMIRVNIVDNILTIYKDSAYKELGEAAPHCTVDLTGNGVYTVAPTHHFGILTWQSGGIPYDFELGSLSNATPISGVEKIKAKYLEVYNAVDRTRFSDEQLATLDANKATIEAFTATSENAYDIIKEEITRIREMIPQGLTNAIDVMDAIFSSDKAEESSWDLVNQHALAWTHVQGTNSVTTPSDQVLAGWRLTKDKYSDISMTVSVDAGQVYNPYVGIVSKAFLIGASSQGNYPKGYAVTLYQSSTEAWVQIHYLDGSGNGGNFKFGVCAWVNNNDVKFVVNGKQFSLWINGYKQTLTNLSVNAEEFTLDNYEGGSVGIFNWDDPTVSTTFTIKEFYGTKIS